VSALVGAAIRRDGVPLRALRTALTEDAVAISPAIEAELLDVLHRPRLARYLDPALRAEVLGQVLMRAVRFDPMLRVRECRDAKDDIYLELAVAASAHTIVSSDDDLLVLNPWRAIRIVSPANFLLVWHR
jgi:putative PIN family toxin of toxin-antitoxin system